MSWRLKDKLVGHWPLNGHARDVSGFNNHGTWVGTEKYVDGPFGNSVADFDESSHIDIEGNINPSGLSKITVSATAKADITDPNNVIVGWWDGTNGLFIASHLSAEGYLVTAGGGNDFGKVVMLIKQIRELVLVYDGTLIGNANRLKLYVDGKYQTLIFGGSASIPSSLPIFSDTNLWIGSVPTLIRAWDGQILNIKIHKNIAFTYDEVIKQWEQDHL